MRSVLILLLLAAPGLAQANGARSRAPAAAEDATAGPGGACLAAITAAERAAGIPANLLRSIAVVESGRRDPATGRLVPWPWTINAEGRGQYFATREQAVAAVRLLQSQGVRSIDVGCAQVNLVHHASAFPSLEAAFDPAANAAYAARFLRSLHAAAGNWPLATARYHSHTPQYGDAYAARVSAVWPDAARHGPWPVAPNGVVLATAATAPRLNLTLSMLDIATGRQPLVAERAARLAPVRVRGASGSGILLMTQPPTTPAATGARGARTRPVAREAAPRPAQAMAIDLGTGRGRGG